MVIINCFSHVAFFIEKHRYWSINYCTWINSDYFRNDDGLPLAPIRPLPRSLRARDQSQVNCAHKDGTPDLYSPEQGSAQTLVKCSEIQTHGHEHQREICWKMWVQRERKGIRKGMI